MIAILSDIHGNLSALKAVLKDALNFGCDRFISLGDVTGYYAQPGECINLLRQHAAINILGNHDHYLISGMNCSRSKIVTEIINYHRNLLDDNQLKWLRNSVDSYSEDDFLYMHGGPKNLQDQYLYTIHEEIIPDFINIFFSGHTHVQILVEFKKKIYCNPGAVGQPRDGDPRAAYAIMNKDKISLRRVSYDIDKTAIEMKRAGFTNSYYENLYTGTQIGGRIDKIKIIGKMVNVNECNNSI